MSAQDRLHRLEHNISKKLNDIRKQRKEETVQSKTHFDMQLTSSILDNVVISSKNERATKQIQQNCGQLNKTLKLRKLNEVEIEMLKLRKLKARAQTRHRKLIHQKSHTVTSALTIVSIPFPKKASF